MNDVAHEWIAISTFLLMNIIARKLENYFFELLGNYAHNSQTRIR